MGIITSAVNKIFTGKRDDPGMAWETAAKTFVCLAFFLTPLVVGWWTADVWESHKMLWLLLTISCGWVCFWVAALRRRTVRWQWSRLDWLVISILVVTGLSTLTSIRPVTAFVPLNGWYAETLPGLVVLFGLYLLIVQLFRDRHDQLLGWASLLAGLAVVSLMQLFQFMDFSLWPPALPLQPFFTPINGSIEALTVMAALASSLALLGWTMSKERWQRWLMIGGVAVGWSILLVSGQALGWTVFALGMILVVLAEARLGTKADTRLIALAVGLAALGMVAQFTNLAVHTPLSPQPDPKIDFKNNATITWSTLVHHIPFGSGPGTWYYDFVTERPVSWNATPFWNIRFAQAGNQWWQIAATTGVFGLIAWLAWLLSAVVCLWRRWQAGGEWTTAAGLLIALTLLLTGFFTTWSLVLLVLFFGSFGLVRAAMTPGAKPQALTIRTGLGFAVTLVAALLWLYPAGRLYASDLITRQAVRAINRVEPIARVEGRLQQALRLNRQNLNAAALLANAYVVELQISLQGSDTAQQQAITQKIANQLTTLQDIDPQNPVGYEISNNILSALTGVIGDVELEAQKNFQTLRRLEPSSPIHDVGYGQTLMVSRARILAAADVSAAQKELAEKLRSQALAAYDLAIQKKSDYLQAHVSRVQALAAGSEYDRALAALEPLLIQYPQLSGLRVNQADVLSQQGRGDEAVAAYEQAIRLGPTDPTLYLAFVAHYQRTNDPLKAKEILRRGLTAVPDNSQLQQALDSLP